MKTVVCFLILLVANFTFSQNGEYFSVSNVAGKEFRFKITLNCSEETVSLEDVDKKDFKTLGSCACKNDSVQMSFNSFGITFKGKYFSQGDSIIGKMFQSGIEWQSNFFRTISTTKSASSRPQTPVGPFPYSSKELKIKSADKTLIFGTYTKAINENAETPIVIFASGSGPQDRDCNIFSHKSFAVLADYLARNGVSSFRFDDRGTGKSKADYSKATLTNFGEDVSACLNYFSGKKYKNRRVGLLGHSEGGMHILLAQEKAIKNVDFMIFLACIGGTGMETLVQQQYEIPLNSGLGEAVAQWNKQLFTDLSNCLKTVSSQNGRTDSMKLVLKKAYTSSPVGAIQSGTNVSTFVSTYLGLMDNEWMREFVLFDAKEKLSKLEIPALAVFGSKDVQVNPIFNLQKFNEAFTKKSNLLTSSTLPNLNHLLQTCVSCSVSEYGNINETTAPIVLETVLDFIWKSKKVKN